MCRETRGRVLIGCSTFLSLFSSLSSRCVCPLISSAAQISSNGHFKHTKCEGVKEGVKIDPQKRRWTGTTRTEEAKEDRWALCPPSFHPPTSNPPQTHTREKQGMQAAVLGLLFLFFFLFFYSTARAKGEGELPKAKKAKPEHPIPSPFLSRLLLFVCTSFLLASSSFSSPSSFALHLHL